MINNSKGFIVVIAICLLLTLIPITIHANSAEPPSLVILIKNPPKDTSIVMISNNHKPKARVHRVAWEGYYAFYSSDMQSNNNYKFRVTTNGEYFVCTFNKPLRGYNEVLTLDLAKRELVYGKYPFSSVLLVSIRLVLTLIIEGIIFLMFGFRQKNSWRVFIIINLFTQGILNIWLNSESSLMPSYFILTLVFGEFFVFLTEMIGLPILINEHKKVRVIIYTFVANLISLVLGGYLISVLPV